jgi:exonuclease III
MISKNMTNLCSLNVNGIHGREKRNRVVEWIKTQKCSIAFLQETHLEENIENEIKNKQISLFIVVTVHPQVGG